MAVKIQYGKKATGQWKSWATNPHDGRYVFTIVKTDAGEVFFVALSRYAKVPDKVGKWAWETIADEHNELNVMTWWDGQDNPDPNGIGMALLSFNEDGMTWTTGAWRNEYAAACLPASVGVKLTAQADVALADLTKHGGVLPPAVEAEFMKKIVQAMGPITGLSFDDLAVICKGIEHESSFQDGKDPAHMVYMWKGTAYIKKDVLSDFAELTKPLPGSKSFQFVEDIPQGKKLLEYKVAGAFFTMNGKAYSVGETVWLSSAVADPYVYNGTLDPIAYKDPALHDYVVMKPFIWQGVKYKKGHIVGVESLGVSLTEFLDDGFIEQIDYGTTAAVIAATKPPPVPPAKYKVMKGFAQGMYEYKVGDHIPPDALSQAQLEELHEHGVIAPIKHTEPTMAELMAKDGIPTPAPGEVIATVKLPGVYKSGEVIELSAINFTSGELTPPPVKGPGMFTKEGGPYGALSLNKPEPHVAQEIGGLVVESYANSAPAIQKHGYTVKGVLTEARAIALRQELEIYTGTRVRNVYVQVQSGAGDLNLVRVTGQWRSVGKPIDGEQNVTWKAFDVLV